MLNMKKKILTAAVATLAATGLAAAHAAVNGAYVGGILGYGNVHEGNTSSTDVTEIEPGLTGTSNFSSNDRGIAGQIFGGYQFTQNFAAELGVTKFSNATQKVTGSVAGVALPTIKGTVKTSAVDLVAKGMLPLQNGFGLYGKLGVAYLMASADVKAEGLGSASASQHNLYPTFGVGASYDINQNLVADVSWNRIQKVGSSNSNLPSTDLFGAGLSYHFG